MSIQYTASGFEPTTFTIILLPEPLDQGSHPKMFLHYAIHNFDEDLNRVQVNGEYIKYAKNGFFIRKSRTT